MKPIGTRVIRTQKLVLRPPEETDAAALLACRSLAMTLPEAERKLPEMVAEARKPYGFHWVITLDGRAVGRIRGWDVSPYNGYLQLGYDVSPELRGRGIMTEAVGAVIRYLLTEADANRVYCSVRGGNLASRRVCEKNGMRHEGTLRQHYARQDGGYDDVMLFGIVKADLEEMEHGA